MVIPVSRNMSSKSKNKNSISILRKEIFKLELIGVSDFMKAEKLSTSIVEEWFTVREKFRRRIKGNKMTESAYENYISDEEIVIGLLVLLNKKCMDVLKDK